VEHVAILPAGKAARPAPIVATVTNTAEHALPGLDTRVYEWWPAVEPPAAAGRATQKAPLSHPSRKMGSLANEGAREVDRWQMESRRALRERLEEAERRADEAEAAAARTRDEYMRLREVVLFAIDLARTTLGGPENGTAVRHDQQVPLVGRDLRRSEDGLDDLIDVTLVSRLQRAS
jgi:hypothetical protein